MKSKGAITLLSLAIGTTVAFYNPGIVGSQSAPQAVEVKLEDVSFPVVKDQLFGPAGLVNQNQPFELKAQDVVFTPQQVQDFFVPPPGAATQMDFARLVERANQLPGTEAKIEGIVEVQGANGMVTRVPFEAKVETGEVKIEGLNLTQAQFNSLVDRLQAVPGTQELKIEAVVDGRQVEVKFETEAGKVRTETRSRERRHRGQEGTSATLNNEHARDRGKDLDHSLQGHDRAVRERERVERGEKPERVERADQPRMDRRERVERVERVRPERVERIERVERVERPERVDRVEKPDRSGRH